MKIWVLKSHSTITIAQFFSVCIESVTLGWWELLNGHPGYDFGRWSIKLWGKNILDARYATRGFYFGLEPIWNEELQEHEYPDKKYVSYGDPAHFGMTVEFVVNLINSPAF